MSLTSVSESFYTVRARSCLSTAAMVQCCPVESRGWLYVVVLVASAVRVILCTLGVSSPRGAVDSATVS